MAQTVKNLPAMQEAMVRSVGQKDLDKGMATHSSILAIENSMDRGAGKAPACRVGYSPQGHKKSDMTEPLTL